MKHSYPNNEELKPFVKWVGGKRLVIKNHLSKLLPKKFNNYIEPFVGGGAMLCWLQPKKAIINDINSELITSYKTIKNNFNELINKLDELKEHHNKRYYYDIRRCLPNNNIDIASRFIYLNKTCFNGLYRVNSKGEFNVPYNFKEKNNLRLYEYNNILHWNTFLNKNKITIANQNYLKILDKAKAGDFIYCDPPYDYEEGTNGFDAYDKSSFGKENQIKLANKLKELDKQNVKWMLSNHDTKLINELYKDFKIIRFNSNRMINSNSNDRINTGKEVVIINYEE